MPDAPGARPRNVDYYLQRMAGYSKNTISIQPQTKPQYYPGDTVVFRLPTNSILSASPLGWALPLGASCVLDTPTSCQTLRSG